MCARARMHAFPKSLCLCVFYGSAPVKEKKYRGNLKKNNTMPLFVRGCVMEKYREGGELDVHWGEIMETDEGSGEEECGTCEME